MAELFPPTEPYEQGLLDVGDGNLDLSCPATTAWELARAWPGAELLIDDHSGHRGSDVKRAWMPETLAKFGSR